MNQEKNIRKKLKTNSVLFGEIFKQLEGLHLHHLKSKTLFEITGYVNSVRRGSYLELYNPKALDAESEFVNVYLSSPKIESVLEDLKDAGFIPAVVVKEDEDTENQEENDPSSDENEECDCPLCSESLSEGLDSLLYLINALAQLDKRGF